MIILIKKCLIKINIKLIIYDIDSIALYNTMCIESIDEMYVLF